MAETRRRPPPEEIARLAEAHFGKPVERISAPGGSSRDSLRVHFADSSVIATWRESKGQRARELAILQGLDGAGGLVPRCLGVAGEMFFQSDAGRRRLSVDLARASVAEQVVLARRAGDSLMELRARARAAGINADLPPVGLGRAWRRGFVRSAEKLADRLGLVPPALDRRGLIDAVAAEPREFVKWDARPGNAAVRADGGLVWFDFEQAGLRHGIEDLAWLAGDEFWPLDREATLFAWRDLLTGIDAAERRMLDIFTALHMAGRLRLILHKPTGIAWIPVAEGLRYDQIGRAPEVIAGLCRRALGWARSQPLTHPLAGFFDQVADWTEAATATSPTAAPPD